MRRPQLLINRYGGRVRWPIDCCDPPGRADQICLGGRLRRLHIHDGSEGGAKHGERAKADRILNRTQIAAGWTQGTGYPGPNTNQLNYLPAELIPQVNVNPQNASKCIIDDANWLVEMRPDGKTNADHIQERWLAWCSAELNRN